MMSGRQVIGAPVGQPRTVAAPVSYSVASTPQVYSQGIQQGVVGQPQVVKSAAPVQTAYTAAPQTFRSVHTAAPQAAYPGARLSASTPVVHAAHVLPTTPQVISAVPSAQRIVAGSQVPLQPARVIVTPGTQVVAGAPVAQQRMSAQEVMTKNAYEVKHQNDPQLSNLKEVKRLCGLADVPFGEAVSMMKPAAAMEGGSLSRAGFLQAYTDLLQQKGVAIPSEATQNAVFDLFDRDDNDVVDLMELICGISLLCKGSEDEKIHAVFDAFDANGDGSISMDEMFKFLSSVFKVVLTNNVKAAMATMGVMVESPEDLASVTAVECFKTADLNHDGKLNVEEFKQWFYQPRNDPSFLFNPVKKMLQ
eukprot:TRINITY_DN14274_c0_g2_i2.p1 TRINITY_DN14274_c0_g2~~TRINITY_DN14274_c0_g2_i2.p1  ORF type:complete len:388 (+),score=89.87 TRINITY_DN14274_c0_g2_i2:77-1165(+)